MAGHLGRTTDTYFTTLFISFPMQVPSLFISRPIAVFLYIHRQLSLIKVCVTELGLTFTVTHSLLLQVTDTKLPIALHHRHLATDT